MFVVLELAKTDSSCSVISWVLLMECCSSEGCGHRLILQCLHIVLSLFVHARVVVFDLYI